VQYELVNVMRMMIFGGEKEHEVREGHYVDDGARWPMQSDSQFMHVPTMIKNMSLELNCKCWFGCEI
jgi:hypothetical protein